MLLKWIFDRVISLLGLLILWPVLLVAILVKIKMPGGPVLFVQKRVGKDGKLFKCHKFRTTLKYRLEDEMIADYVAQKQKEGDTRDAQDIAVAYNDTVIYPDKVRLNCLNSELF